MLPIDALEMLGGGPKTRQLLSGILAPLTGAPLGLSNPILSQIPTILFSLAQVRLPDLEKDSAKPDIDSAGGL